MRGQVGADFGDLVVEIADEGCAFVGFGVGAQADVVGVGAWVYGIGEVADGAQAVSFVAVRLLD